jgi:ubiquinone biosynthesis protein
MSYAPGGPPRGGGAGASVRLERWLRQLGRAGEVAFILGLYAAGWLAGLLWLALTGASEGRRHQWTGAWLLRLFRRLGATYIKLGQILSTRPDLLPPHLIGALERLQDDVGPFAFAHVERVVQQDFGLPVDLLFPDFQRAPVASASVAQVHRATLPDGRAVAVKVRRPHVVELCDLDLALLRLGARLLSPLPWLRNLSPVESVDELGRAIRLQLDFRVEAANGQRFAELFRRRPDVVFPAVVESLSSERVLTMLFIEGDKLPSAERGAAGGRALDHAQAVRLARIGLRTMVQMIFEDGFVHADLHPGNLLVTPDGRLALLDVGLVAELSVEGRELFTRYFAAWVAGDGRTMAQVLLEQSLRVRTARGYVEPLPPLEAQAAFVAEVELFVARYTGLRVGEVQLGAVLFDLLQLVRRHRLRLDPAFTVVNIAVAVTEGIAKQLAPELDLLTEVAPFFAEHGWTSASSP